MRRVLLCCQPFGCFLETRAKGCCVASWVGRGGRVSDRCRRCGWRQDPTGRDATKPCWAADKTGRPRSFETERKGGKKATADNSETTSADGGSSGVDTGSADITAYPVRNWNWDGDDQACGYLVQALLFALVSAAVAWVDNLDPESQAGCVRPFWPAGLPAGHAIDLSHEYFLSPGLPRRSAGVEA